MKLFVSLLLLARTFAAATTIADDSDQANECPICFGPFDDSRPAFALDCKHCYHKDCMVTWASSGHDRNRCPQCREQIDSKSLGIVSPPPPSLELARLTALIMALWAAAASMREGYAFLALVTFIVPILASRLPSTGQWLSNACADLPILFSTVAKFGIAGLYLEAKASNVPSMITVVAVYMAWYHLTMMDYSVFYTAHNEAVNADLAATRRASEAKRNWDTLRGRPEQPQALIHESITELTAAESAASTAAYRLARLENYRRWFRY